MLLTTPPRDKQGTPGVSWLSPPHPSLLSSLSFYLPPLCPRHPACPVGHRPLAVERIWE